MKPPAGVKGGQGSQGSQGSHLTLVSVDGGAPPGAGDKEWTHWSVILGLGPDLLPIADDPRWPISKESELAQKPGNRGKVPSLLNSRGHVVGYAGWSEKVAGDVKLAAWCARRYGIGLQTRTLIAIDVDVDDPGVAGAVYVGMEAWRVAKGLPPFPIRTRAGSARFLALVRGPDGVRVRKATLLGGAGPDGVIPKVELLGKGQQCVVAGRHPSGVRYEWSDEGRGEVVVDGLPITFWQLTQEEIEELWAVVAGAIGAKVEGAGMVRFEDVSGGSGGGRIPPSLSQATDDPIEEHLYAEGWVTGEGGQGYIHVRCPWEHEHTTDSGGSSTVWMRAGTGGHKEGRFNCKHAHCAGRGTNLFLKAIGYLAKDFKDESSGRGGGGGGGGAGGGASKLPALKRQKTTGRALADLSNIVSALEAGYLPYKFGFDAFRHDTVMSPTGCNEWRPITDADYIELRLALAQPPANFMAISREAIRDAVEAACNRNKFDSAIEWLESLTWDGVPRCERMWHTYFGAEDTPYTQAVGLYFATAMAGRIMSPGCQADGVPILSGPQGSKKTTGVKALVPSPEHYVELAFDARDDDQARKMRGKLIGELSELRGLSRADIDKIKSNTTRTQEEWVPKFKEKPVMYPRRCVWVGTTNADEFLNDATGERRWLPINVAVLHPVDVLGLERDRDQLWAERLVLWRRHGIQATYEQLGPLMPGAQESFKVQDPWEEIIGDWLNDLHFGPPGGSKTLRMSDVLVHALHLKPERITKAEQMRAGKILRLFGYDRKVGWGTGKTERGWEREETLEELAGLPPVLAPARR